jgi:hypothetical protein
MKRLLVCINHCLREKYALVVVLGPWLINAFVAPYRNRCASHHYEANGVIGIVSSAWKLLLLQMHLVLYSSCE